MIFTFPSLRIDDADYDVVYAVEGVVSTSAPDDGGAAYVSWLATTG